MKKLLFALLMFFSMPVLSEEVIATPEEEKAMMESLRGWMERLQDPDWWRQIKEDGDGCWFDKQNKVEEGTVTSFKGVPVKCVTYDLDIPGKKVFLFFPTRLVEACDRINKPYNKCLKR